MLKYILLGFIDYKACTGYDLKQFIDSSTGNFWHAHHSQIYTLLRRLEEEGLLSSELGSADEGREKRFYHITDAGRRDLLAWQARPQTHMSAIKEEFLVRLFFAGLRERSEVLAELRMQRAMHAAKLDAYLHMEPQIIEVPVHNGPELASHLPFWMATLKFGLNFEQNYVTWLDELIAQLEAGA